MVIDRVTYRVRSGKEQEFEAHQEEWLRILRRSRGFISQVVLRSLEDPAEYHAEVRWVNKEYRDRFSAHESKESRTLVQKGAAILEGPPSHHMLEYV